VKQTSKNDVMMSLFCKWITTFQTLYNTSQIQLFEMVIFN